MKFPVRVTTELTTEELVIARVHLQQLLSLTAVEVSLLLDHIFYLSKRRLGSCEGDVSFMLNNGLGLNLRASQGLTGGRVGDIRGWLKRIESPHHTQVRNEDLTSMPAASRKSLSRIRSYLTLVLLRTEHVTLETL